MSEIKDWGKENGTEGETVSGQPQARIGKRGMEAMQGVDGEQENSLKKDRFVVRIGYPDRPTQIFVANFVEKKYLGFEEQNSRPDFSISVTPPSLALEALDFIAEKRLEGTPLSQLVAKMCGKEDLGFIVKVDVPYKVDGLPRNELIRSFDGIREYKAANIIRVFMGKEGFTAESTTLSPEQLKFCLSLLKDSITFTLDSVNSENPVYFNPGKDENSVRSEHFLRNFSQNSKALYKYLLATINEVSAKL